jgi:hypothetical protein
MHRHFGTARRCRHQALERHPPPLSHMFSRIGIAKARRRTSKAATLDSEVAASQRMLDPFHPSVRLPRRVRTLYKNEYPAHLDEKEQLQWQEQQLVGVSTTNFLPKESPFGDVFLAAVTVAPIFAAIIMTAVVCFGDSHFITTSTAGYLLRLDSAPDADADSYETLWLSLSGFCMQKGAGKMICRASPFATVYTAAYDGATVGSLRPFLPVNYASQAGLLLAALIAFIACAIFQTWASFDIRTAEMLESRRKREWVAEWMQARRLECLACVRRASSRNRLIVLSDAPPLSRESYAAWQPCRPSIPPPAW